MRIPQPTCYLTSKPLSQAPKLTNVQVRPGRQGLGTASSDLNQQPLVKLNYKQGRRSLSMLQPCKSSKVSNQGPVRCSQMVPSLPKKEVIGRHAPIIRKLQSRLLSASSGSNIYIRVQLQDSWTYLPDHLRGPCSGVGRAFSRLSHKGSTPILGIANGIQSEAEGSDARS